MTVYHGSSVIVEKPDVNHSFRPLDFGKGFYVTTNKEQAERWARRKARYSNDSHPIVNCYEMSDDIGTLAVKNSDGNLEEWIDFVCDCRDEKEIYKQYDIIIGQVANDKVMVVVDMYHAGIWNRERAIREMKVYPCYDQIAFITQKAIDEMLTFDQSYEVEII